MTAGGIAAAVGAVILGVASIVGWASTTSTTAGGSAVSAELDGAALFRAKGCSTCHDGPDTHSQFDGFPDLSDVPSFAGSRVAGMSAQDYVAQSIEEPQAFISPAFHGGVGPTTFMPTLDVSSAEVDALVAYLLHG